MRNEGQTIILFLIMCIMFLMLCVLMGINSHLAIIEIGIMRTPR